MNFKEFLYDYSFRFSDGEPESEDVYTCDPEDECIAVRTLGEWAWGRLKDDYLVVKDFGRFAEVKTKRRFDSVKNYWAYEIAVACLGEKEVKKRLGNIASMRRKAK